MSEPDSRRLPLTAQARWDRYWSQPETETAWWRRPAADMLALVEQLSPAEYPRVLDLGCGLGRHSIPFALAGFQVTAVDVSPAGLAALRQWAGGLGLAVTLRQAAATDWIAGPEAFDLVISYNLIYHGFREQLFDAVRNVHRLLRPLGLFYFTCPSRRDEKYGEGQPTAPHTYINSLSVTPGDMHYFMDDGDLADMMRLGFTEEQRSLDEGTFENHGRLQRFSNYHLLWRKAAPGR